VEIKNGGYAFVEFENRRDAERAVDKLDGIRSGIDE
jgi:hypothetical protein